MDMNDASRIIAVVDKRIERRIGVEGTTETTWGEVCAVSADGKMASAYLYGDTTNPSQNFRIPGALALSVGDKVKVAWNERGERWVYDIVVASAYKKVAIDHNAGTIHVGDGTAAPAILIADSSGAVVGVHNHDADYSPLGHDHDAAYSGIGHDHDSDYSGISHDHDSDYAPLAHDHLDNIVASDFATATAGSLSLTGGAEGTLSTPQPSLTTPASGNFRVYVAGFWTGSINNAALLQMRVRLADGGTSEILQNFRIDTVSGTDYGLTFWGWLDSASAGTDRAQAWLGNNETVTASIRALSASNGTLSTYSDGAASYVTHLYIWTVRLP